MKKAKSVGKLIDKKELEQGEKVFIRNMIQA